MMQDQFEQEKISNNKANSKEEQQYTKQTGNNNDNETKIEAKMQFLQQTKMYRMFYKWKQQTIINRLKVLQSHYFLKDSIFKNYQMKPFLQWKKVCVIQKKAAKYHTLRMYVAFWDIAQKLLKIRANRNRLQDCLRKKALCLMYQRHREQIKQLQKMKNKTDVYRKQVLHRKVFTGLKRIKEASQVQKQQLVMSELFRIAKIQRRVIDSLKKHTLKSKLIKYRLSKISSDKPNQNNKQNTMSASNSNFH